MTAITQLIPYGGNLPGAAITTEQMVGLLTSLESRLADQALPWRAVSLLLVANAKGTSEQRVQHGSDSAVVDGLRIFCDSRQWHPSLIGSSVHSAFFQCDGCDSSDIDDGLLLVAFVNQVLERIPVGVEMTAHRAERPRAASVALHRAIKASALQYQRELGLSVPEHVIPQTSVGLVFSSGSGHMDSVDDVDFKECFAVGQDLLAAANTVDAHLYGGCSTNKSREHYQCLYYSEEVAGQVRYASSYQHGAVVTLLPHTLARSHLAHPYTAAPVPPLDVKFHDREQYADGRSFFVREINGAPVEDFLKEYWPGASEFLDEWIDGHVPIPGRPEAHGVTIGSSGSRTDDKLWPNVAVWLEREGDETLLRLVRAEPEESNHFLMEMAPDPVEALKRNAVNLMEGLAFMPHSDDMSVLAFLCESRKILLETKESNIEAEMMIDAAPSKGALIGIYLNGEYSTGAPRSIGYHNYSQIAAMLPAIATDNLPYNVQQALAAKGTQLFLCHSSRDKSAVREFAGCVEQHIFGSKDWIDEDKLVTGDELRDAIKGAIATPNQFFIPFFTANSATAPWFQRELKWAFKQEEAQERRFILPVVIDAGGVDVLDMFRKAWGDKFWKRIEQRLAVVVRSTELIEIEAKAAKLASDIRARAEREKQEAGEGPQRPMTSLRPLRDDDGAI